MAALTGFAALLLAAASIQAAESPPTGAASVPADAEKGEAQQRPAGEGEAGGPVAPSVRRPPDDSELDSNAIVDFPQDI